MALPCVILAGGLGTRMRPFTESFPKALIPVLGTPFADLQLASLAGAGVTEVIYCVGYRGEMIHEHVGDGSRHGLRVGYVDEGDKLRGTAGALRCALDQGKLPESFHVLYGDSYLALDLPVIEAAWRLGGLPAQMTVLRNQGRWDQSNVVFDAGRVRVYAPDPCRGKGFDWIDYGLSTLSSDIVEREVAAATVAQLPDLWKRLSAAGLLGGFEVSERFYEVGSAQGLADLEEYLRRPPGGAD